jgi:hypothetical protein
LSERTRNGAKQDSERSQNLGVHCAKAPDWFAYLQERHRGRY